MKKRLRKKTSFPFILLVLYALFMVFLNVASFSTFTDIGAGGQDRSIHFIEYAVFAFLFMLTVLKEKNRYIYTIIVGFTYGFITEAIQLVIPARHFSPADLAANWLGVSLIVILFSLYEGKNLINLKTKVKRNGKRY